jgi:hypothetical protein
MTNIVNSRLASPGKTILRWDTLDAVRRVDVLYQGKLPARGTTLA